MLFLHISFVFAKIQDIKNHLANQHKSTSNPPPPPSLSIYLYMCTYNTYVDRVNKIRKKIRGKNKAPQVHSYMACFFFLQSPNLPCIYLSLPASKNIQTVPPLFVFITYFSYLYKQADAKAYRCDKQYIKKKRYQFTNELSGEAEVTRQQHAKYT